ncbi:hydroxymethylbilane synthase [candidate division WOR-1 bacterium RIFCSPHIGHO2_02_FULL_45_12]|nr:MAG: hydroxymethylbilane synthase [candidate division WOR-1 bacterium RIFCSPHIGHO2_02_FULL_45_12]
MKRTKIIIGSRGSKLALTQSQDVLHGLAKNYPEIKFDLKIIKTRGDKLQDVALAKIGSKGFFTKELEEALLAKEIDVAVHSLKDLPVESPQGLAIGAITKRVDARDILARNKSKLEPGDTIGTSSLRRQAQLRAWGKDFRIADLRGNLDTRLRKLKEGQFAAIVIALAGLKRLQIETAYEILPIEMMMPAPGQGALAVQVRAGDDFVVDIVSKLNDQATALAVIAERALLLSLGGGCQVPVGAYATINENILVLKGLVISLDGKKKVAGEIREALTKRSAESIGQALAKNLLARGAGEILCNIKK